MTGQDIIQFIKDNRLEDSEIKWGADDHQMMFGDYIKIPDCKELAYFIGYPMTETTSDSIQAVIEVFDKNSDGFKWTHPTANEALKMRGLEPATLI